MRFASFLRVQIHSCQRFREPCSPFHQGEELYLYYAICWSDEGKVENCWWEREEKWGKSVSFQ